MSTDPLTIIEGDCIEVMRSMPENSVDAVVTDPPYGLGFMGKEWDSIGDTGRGSRARKERAAEVTPIGIGHTTSKGPYLAAGIDSLRSAGAPFQQWTEAWATEALRVLKPGGYLLSFGGTRTYHRMTCAIEDAGFEIRDCLVWMYGSGFPKSLDVSKAFDKKAGAERNTHIIPTKPGNMATRSSGPTDMQSGFRDVSAPATDLARQWDGWGTALKPAHEPIVLARKPLIGTVVANVERYGTGALNIDGARIGTEGGTAGHDYAKTGLFGIGGKATIDQIDAGRWPANILLGCCGENPHDPDCAAAMLDEQSGERPSGKMHAFHRNGPQRKVYGADALSGYMVSETYGDTGGASRFFYTAKASRSDRGPGNTHPTVKPVELMRYLVRLVTPPGGLVLDPFAGSGTTGQAALAEGFRCTLIEKEAEYVAGIKAWRGAMQLGFGMAAR